MVPKPPGRRDELVEESKAWAQSWHGKMAVITMRDGRQFPGLAIAAVDRGGWGVIRVYTPKPVYNYSRSGYAYPVTDRDYGAPFPYYKVGKKYSENMAPLEHWDDNDELEALKQLPGPLMLQEGS